MENADDWPTGWVWTRGPELPHPALIGLHCIQVSLPFSYDVLPLMAVKVNSLAEVAVAESYVVQPD